MFWAGVCPAGVCPAGAGADAPEPIPVWAHYMPWFRAEPQPNGQILWEHWQWFGRGTKHDPDRIRKDGRRDIASVYYPLIGPYDGRDPAVLEYHFLTARSVGIEGFIADWYGPNTYSDEVFTAMVRMAERTQGKVAICLEEKSFFPPYAEAATREDVLRVAEQQIRHALALHAVSPAYLRINGRPVFYMFINHQQGVLGNHLLTPEELTDLLHRFASDDIFFVRAHAESAYAGAADGFFAWVGDATYRSLFYDTAQALLATGAIEYMVGSAVPGFDDTGVWGWGDGPRITDRRGTAEYDEHWETAILRRPHMIQIATWNDFEEGSTIEPTEEYGFMFVDRTEEWVARLNGRRAILEDNVWPLRLYRLRCAVAALTDQGQRTKWTRTLDRFSEKLTNGHRFLMEFRLKRMEKNMRSAQGE